MSVRKTPQEKKEQSYKHDRVQRDPHRNLRVSKTIEGRQRRRLANQEDLSQSEQNAIDRTHNGHGSWTDSLPEHLDRAYGSRAGREFRRFFRRGYDEQNHEVFRRKLLEWMSGTSRFSIEIAKLYGETMQDVPLRPVEGERFTFSSPWAQRVYFLSHFFSKEKKLRPKFEGWIRRTLAEQK